LFLCLSCESFFDILFVARSFFVPSCLFHNCSENINSLAHAGVQLLDHALDVVLQKLAETHKHDQGLVKAL
jgi:hypothetical protein